MAEGLKPYFARKYLSREFLAMVFADLLGAAIAAGWVVEESTTAQLIGASLTGIATIVYGFIRTAQKRDEKKAEALKELNKPYVGPSEVNPANPT